MEFSKDKTMSRSHPSKLTLSKEDHGLELTHEEFAEADFEEPWRYERVNGRLLVMTPAGPDHRDTAEPFRDALVVYKVNHPDIVDKVEQDCWVVTR
jgi:Uma2 family endonuclease